MRDLNRLFRPRLRGESKRLPRLNLDNRYGKRILASTSGSRHIKMHDFNNNIRTISMESYTLWAENTPMPLQRIVDAALELVKNRHAIVYIEGTIIYFKFGEEHLERLQLVFTHLKKANLKISPGKCHLVKKLADFLGHTIDAKEIRPKEDNMKARYIPRPKNKKQLQSFRGLENYYRVFLPKISRITSPLFDLMKRNRRFILKDNQEEAFTIIKKTLGSWQVLKMP
eukprot:GHVN01033504.1.p1 GENE.GHVN01033504.1~~GHVN01033504.1.p1  ORF type:complete len:227 (+),score=8.47 GHVN01033504.1:391-1071(+)